MRELATSLAIALTICLILIGCAPGKGTVVSTIPWPDKEETTYIVHYQAANITGSGNLTIAKEGENYILGQNWKLGDTKLSYSIKVASDDLKPVSGNKTLLNPHSEISVNTTYADNKLRIETETPEGSQTAEMDIPANAYDDDELFFLLRTLPFEKGYLATYTDILPLNAQQYEVTVTVTGREQVEAPAGLFDCWKLELEVAGQKQHMWYTVNSPHYLVKYDDGWNVTLLQEIVG